LLLERGQKYSAEGSYPPIRVAGPNLDYARILMDDYASRNSELTAIHQYLYQHLVLKNNEVFQLIKGIARVEMHHLEMLGELIELLGGDPRYQNGSLTYWHSSYVNYTRDLCPALQADLDGEILARRTYLEHARMIADPYIQAILRRIAQDEEFHEGLFRDMLSRYCR